MAALTELTPEVLDLVLSHLPPQDIAHFGRTCRGANLFIRPSNQVLWRSAFLHVFDDPRGAWELLQPTARAANHTREQAWNWHAELKRRYLGVNALWQDDGTALTDPEGVVNTFLDILETASYSTVTGSEHHLSLNADFLHQHFKKAPRPERIVHDYHRDTSLPLHLMADADRPLTRSNLWRRTLVPDWASKFHVSFPARDPYK
jgi:hypothetical protein